MNNKQGSVLLEVIFSVLILSIVSTSTILIYKDFITIQSNDYKNEINNIELLNSKYFLQKNIHDKLFMNKLSLNHNILYYDKHILLKEVSEFKMNKLNNGINFYICIKNKRCKSFKVPL